MRAPQPRALSEVERKEVLGVLHDREHVDEAPATVYAKLLDAGVYLCSVPTMYRLLRAEGEVTERRRQASHPPATKPELQATRPNAVWSWDITKLLGPVKWTWFYLYTIIDIYSRYVPGWLLARAERAQLAERLLADTIAKQHVDRGQLTIHADRGASMASRPVAFLLADLGVTKSHSRPHCSNDNPTARPVQDPEVSARIPRPVRLLRGCARVLPAVLLLVQRGAPSLRDRVPHPRRCPLRAGRAGPGRASRRAGRGLRRPPRAVRPQATSPTEAVHRRLNQPAHRSRQHNESLINLSH
jgi:transposase InsO family protein